MNLYKLMLDYESLVQRTSIRTDDNAIVACTVIANTHQEAIDCLIKHTQEQAVGRISPWINPWKQQDFISCELVVKDIKEATIVDSDSLAYEMGWI